MDYMIVIALSSAVLLGVGWQGGYPSLWFLDMTGTVGFCAGGGFRRCYSFVDLIYNINASKHL